jgi:hypothetical protein
MLEEHLFAIRHRVNGIGPTPRWTVSIHCLSYGAKTGVLSGNDRAARKLTIKTGRLYNHVVTLVNVRLSAEDAAKAKALREAGTELSEIVRAAIRTEYERRFRRVSSGDVRAELERIYAAHPDPEDLPAPEVDVHDRRAFREAVGKQVRKRTKRR